MPTVCRYLYFVVLAYGRLLFIDGEGKIMGLAVKVCLAFYLALIFFVGAKAPTAMAEEFIVEGDGSYIMDEERKESPAHCKNIAANMAKEDACMKAGVHIKSHTTVKDNEIDEDFIRGMAAHILKITEQTFFVEVSDKGELIYCCHVVAVVDDEEADALLKQYNDKKE